MPVLCAQQLTRGDGVKKTLELEFDISVSCCKLLWCLVCAAILLYIS